MKTGEGREVGRGPQSADHHGKEIKLSHDADGQVCSQNTPQTHLTDTQSSVVQKYDNLTFHIDKLFDGFKLLPRGLFQLISANRALESTVLQEEFARSGSRRFPLEEPHAGRACHTRASLSKLPLYKHGLERPSQIANMQSYLRCIYGLPSKTKFSTYIP